MYQVPLGMPWILVLSFNFHVVGEEFVVDFVNGSAWSICLVGDVVVYYNMNDMPPVNLPELYAIQSAFLYYV